MSQKLVGPPGLIGKWYGTSPSRPFTDYTEIKVFEHDDYLYIWQYDRMWEIESEMQLEFISEWEFQSRAKHSILPATRHTVSVVGICYMAGKGEDFHVEVLNLKFSGTGVTGCETMELNLQKANPSCEKFQVPHYPGCNTILSSDLTTPPFVKGDLSNLKLQGSKSELAVTKLMEPLPDHPEIRVEGLILLKDNKLIAEEYRYGMDATSSHMLASTTKAIVSIIAGIGWDQGLFTLEDIVSDAFPECPTVWGDEEYGGPVRMKHLLSMTTGTKTCPDGLLLTIYLEKDVLANGRLKKPGEKWYYNNDSPALIVPYLERRLGGKMSFADFADKFLFEPLGIESHRWPLLRQKSLDGKSYMPFGGAMYMTLPDMAKFGQLFLHKGIYNGKRVLSEEWVTISTTLQTPVGGYPYGFYWHLNTGFRHFGNDSKRFEDAYIAIGAGEQVICVVPSQGIVFAVCSGSWGSKRETPVILDLFGKQIMEYLDSSLPKL